MHEQNNPKHIHTCTSYNKDNHKRMRDSRVEIVLYTILYATYLYIYTLKTNVAYWRKRQRQCVWLDALARAHPHKNTQCTMCTLKKSIIGSEWSLVRCFPAHSCLRCCRNRHFPSFSIYIYIFLYSYLVGSIRKPFAMSQLVRLYILTYNRPISFGMETCGSNVMNPFFFRESSIDFNVFSVFVGLRDEILSPVMSSAAFKWVKLDTSAAAAHWCRPVAKLATASRYLSNRSRILIRNHFKMSPLFPKNWCRSLPGRSASLCFFESACDRCMHVLNENVARACFLVVWQTMAISFNVRADDANN